jgi:nitrate reductase assembly molybdenum cofactor insertion protein NarJ
MEVTPIGIFQSSLGCLIPAGLVSQQMKKGVSLLLNELHQPFSGADISEMAEKYIHYFGKKPSTSLL